MTMYHKGDGVLDSVERVRSLVPQPLHDLHLFAVEQ